ncbi:hypothetical protein X949_5411 [Burkholderia pseudomallei MSHR5609]|nr:hypothetical protein X949_5411 [Burkholderia pseudomallei MSHR5609]
MTSVRGRPGACVGLRDGEGGVPDGPRAGRAPFDAHTTKSRRIRVEDKACTGFSPGLLDRGRRGWHRFPDRMPVSTLAGGRASPRHACAVQTDDRTGAGAVRNCSPRRARAKPRRVAPPPLHPPRPSRDALANVRRPSRVGRRRRVIRV